MSKSYVVVGALELSDLYGSMSNRVIFCTLYVVMVRFTRY